MYGLDREPPLLRQLRYLVAGISRITAAIVEKIADVVGLEDLDQTLVFGSVLFQPLEFVAARAERAGGRVS